MKFIYSVLVLSVLVFTYGLFTDLKETKDTFGCNSNSHCCSCTSPTPTPKPSPTETPIPTPIPSPTHKPTPTFTPSPTPMITPTPLPTIVPSPSPTPTGVPGGQGGPPDGGDGRSPGPAPCGASAPGGTTLLSVLPKGAGSVELKWTKNPNATNYTVSYGPGSMNYLFGLSNTGNIDSATISELSPNQRYCFVVTPVNDCQPGQISNEICVGSAPLGGTILGAIAGKGEVLGLSSTGSEDSGATDAEVDLSLSNSKITVDPLDLINPIKVFDVPSRITIAALGIDLPVAEAKVENGLWQNFDSFASHGINSASPGEGSNVVIFAHAKWQMFGNLKYAQIGNEITVLTKRGKYKYQVTDIKEVTPDQVSTIAPTSEETLTLYTCIGVNDEKRLVVVAKPV